ncbi:cytochrome B561 [Legionella busanensis]|uniref:Cytochrome B561 n=1 Tax=Legionella busanensis TaxID=190655 RepID=A0A378KHD9_9GAMM|nr:cytochrome B561 [Legionella busanensis]
MENNKNWHYNTITRLLHWVIAFLLIGLISIGCYFNLHKLFSLIAAMLIFLD